MNPDKERIHQLVAAPSEGLNVEIKRWINPLDAEGVTKIVKSAFAIRNRNGGFLIVGFDDKTLEPAARPAGDVRQVFHMDTIQGIISRYASEVFEIAVVFAMRGREEYPVIVIPEGVTTPVAARRDLKDSSGKFLIKEGDVYYRTLSSNGTPSSARARPTDWPEIIKICSNNRDADIEHILKRHLRGLRKRELRAGAIIPNLNAVQYILKCPASLDEYDETWAMTEAFFDADLVDGPADREAFKRNDLTMVVALDGDSREVLGFVDIYHFPDEDLDRILNDTSGDAPFDPARLLPYEQACRAARVYIATIMLKPAYRGRVGSRLLSALIYGMLEFLRKHQFHGRDEITIYSMPTTPEGELLLKGLHFRYEHPVMLEQGNQTGLYSLGLTKRELETQRLDWASKCGDVRLEYA